MRAKPRGPASGASVANCSVGRSIGADGGPGRPARPQYRLLSARPRSLLRLGPLFTRPLPGEPRPAVPGAMVDEAAHDPRDRPLDEQGDEHLHQRHLAVLGPRRLLVVDQAPREVEDLLRQLAAGQAKDQAEWREDG